MPKSAKPSTSLRALLLGALSGARSATPVAMLALRHDRKDLRGAWQGWRAFRSPLGRGALVAGMVGELVGDKLPSTPSRIGFGPLVGRAVAGAFVGAAIGTTARGKDDQRVQAAVLGAVGAIVGSYVGYAARKAVGSVTHLPDPVVAVAEDVATIAGTAAVLRKD